MDVEMAKNTGEVQRIIDSTEPSADLNPEAFKHWIHCNRCFEIYTKKRIVMYLLSCHHILCTNCLGKNTTASNEPNKKMYDTYKCGICSKSVRIRALGNDMPRHLKELFHPNPWVNDVPIGRIYKFQSKHRSHVLNGIESIEKKVIKRENTASDLAKEVQQSKDELQKVLHENMKLERRVRPLLAIYKQKKALKAKMSKEVSFGKNSIVQSSGGAITTTEPQKVQHDSASFTCLNLNGRKSANTSINVSLPQKDYNFTNVTSFVQSRPNSSFHL